MEKGHASDMIMERILCGTELEAECRNPAVISCGGIYIPHSGAREQLIYEIINTSSSEEPVKVVSGYRPRNILHEIILKESMN
ncbi:MAG: hypothetical protein JXA24_00980 [Proteobacteria bacterium]|nr:hypothetical protein [Pseudomonadota bacterium]